jgi:hypothetical protein
MLSCHETEQGQGTFREKKMGNVKLHRLGFLVAAVAFISAGIVPVAAHAGNIVVNGGMEDGSLDGWTINPWFAAFHYGGTGNDGVSFAHTGTYGAALDNAGNLASMSQVLSTTAGHTYDISFWLASPLDAGPNNFQPIFDGVNLIAISDTPEGWTKYSYVSGPVGSNSTTLEFDWQTSQDGGSYMALDDVIVTDTRASAVPLAASVWQGLVLLTGIGAAVWKKSRSVMSV